MYVDQMHDDHLLNAYHFINRWLDEWVDPTQETRIQMLKHASKVFQTELKKRNIDVTERLTRKNGSIPW